MSGVIYVHPEGERDENKLEGYEKIRTVGKGAFGTAVLYKNTVKDILVVIKEINMIELTAAERQMALNEVQVLNVLNHPNIVRSFERDGVLMIEMEYADGGTLSQFLLRRKRHLPEQEVLLMFQQICAAIQHMHSHNILHRDLKTANVFLTKDHSIKVGDFGISKAMSTRAQAQTVLGTPYYISPEMCEGKQYDQKSDIWALGCILYEMACLKKAFQGPNLPALVNVIMKGQFEPIPHQYSPYFRQMVNQLLQKDPNLRPSAATLVAATIPRALDSISKYASNWQSDSLASFNRSSQDRSILYDLRAFRTSFSLTPIPLPPRIRIKELAVSSTHFIALTTELSVLTWGEGSRGQLGHGDNVAWKEAMTPVSALGDHKIVTVAAGDGFSVFVSDSGMMLTCGDGTYGCLGHGDWSHLSKPKLIENLLQTDVVNVRCGPRHVAALSTEGALYTWGQGDGGRLGIGHEENCASPTSINLPDSLIPKTVHCGSDCTAVITSKGYVIACGRNTFNKLGLSHSSFFTGTKIVEKSLSFIRVKSIKSAVVDISLGTTHSCFLTEDGSVITTGRNEERQLGHRKDQPALVSKLADVCVKHVLAGPTYTLATSEENIIYFWGTRFAEQPAHQSIQSLSMSFLRPSTTEEVIESPKDILALYASPQQIAKGNIINFGSLFSVPGSLLLLVHTTAPLPSVEEQTKSKSSTIVNIKEESDDDSLGPVPDWIKAEVAESVAPWNGIISGSNIPLERY